MKVLVVAKHREDTAWTADVPDGWRIRVVTKDLEVPNAGREASSWLWAMEQMWVDADPDDQIAFVQGDPFPHDPHLLTRLGRMESLSYVPIGNQHHVSDWNGYPHEASGLPIRQFWSEHIGGDCPKHFPFVAGGQFAISGDNLCSRDRDFYSELYEAAQEDRGPWILERLWGTIL